MAEVAGLVVGGVSLAVSFKACIDLLDCFCAARDIDRDYADCENLIPNAALLHRVLQDIQSLLSDQDKLWGLLLGQTLLNPCSVPAAGNRGRPSLPDELLTLRPPMNRKKRYGLRASPSTPASGEEYRLSFDDNAQLANVIQALANLRIQPQNNERIDRSMNRGHRLRWMIHDKAKFEGLLQEISSLVSKLNDLTQCSLTHSLMSAIRKLGEMTRLAEIAQSRVECQIDEPVLASLSDARVEQLATQRIMDALWFRLMHDRRASLSMPHPGTFEWALKDEAPSRRWHSLPQWLKKGNGLYWISGKAAAGKSTLMKLIHNHSRTITLLHSWAGTSTLTVASFFFYHLGTHEQKSQQGLFRALLYEIMAGDLSLMQRLLPDMWREAHQSDDRLMPPSQSEIDYAFRELFASDLLGRKYCFFIDGLDEFSGDISEGVRIVQNLAAAPNVKVLVSSRPLLHCAAAFSLSPRLELQDLTRPDMTAYVQKHIGSHANMKRMLWLQRTEAEQLMINLVNKASGVFLWLVLVCRTLHMGLDGCDRLTDLEQRLDELPAHLDQLFRRIFEKIVPAYRDYAIFMLRSFCEAYRLGKDGLETIAIALADNHVFDTAKIMGGSLMQEDGAVMCQALQARLQHRCHGLLEVYDMCGGKHCKHYRESFTGQHLPDMVAFQVCCDLCQRRRFKQSRVRFIHRTLLSFLENDGLSEFANKECGAKAVHDPLALLACIFFYQIPLVTAQDRFHDAFYRRRDAAEDRLVSIMFSCKSKIDQNARSQFSFPCTEWARYTRAISETRTEMYGVNVNKDAVLAEESLALAIEVGHESLFRAVRNSCGRGPLNRFLSMDIGRGILYHASEQPMLRALSGDAKKRRSPPPTLAMTRAFLSAGCNPPNAVVDHRLTVWTNLLTRIGPKHGRNLRQVLKLCGVPFEHGADVAFARQLVVADQDRRSRALQLNKATRTRTHWFWDELAMLLSRLEPNLGENAATPPTSTSQNQPGSSRKRPAPMTPITDGARKRVRSQDHEDLEGGSQASISQS